MKPRAVCHIYAQFGQTEDRIDEELAHLLDLGLVCDTEMPIHRMARYRSALSQIRQVGGLIAPTIYPPDLDATITDHNWWKLSAATCERLLDEVRREFEPLGLGPLEAINTYTPGNGLVEACRKAGVGYMLGFCAPIVIEDGDWEIAHYGSPLAPYFISDDDFRKPEAPSDRADAVMMASMELRNPLVCLSHWSEGPWCPLNAQAADRWLEPSDLPHPFLQIAEDWIRQTELDGNPRFFQLNLQYFFAEKCYEHNRRALEWLAAQRDAGRLEITGLRNWGARLKREKSLVLQSTYWRAEMPGYHVGHRPGIMPDILVDEDACHQAVWQCPEATPHRLYDYTVPWDYPAFQPDGSAPASRPQEKIDVNWTVLDERPDERRVEFSIQADPDITHSPLALWEVLDGLASPFEVEVDEGWSVRVAPHPAGLGGVVILESKIRGSKNATLRIRHSEREVSRSSRSWGNLLAASTFTRDGTRYTTLAAQTPERFEVTIRLKEPGASAVFESFCGIDYQRCTLSADPLSIVFDGSHLACWHRAWGVGVDDLIVEGAEEVETGLRRKSQALLDKIGIQNALPEPGYQLFGNIRDKSRMDREIGAKAGRLEIVRLNEWFRSQRPEAGAFLVEVHAGILLPRGSITKVLGHEFDVIQCAPGLECRGLCFDYPQSWDWGASAWVQWRWLKVRLEGIAGQSGAPCLHLHAFDPEYRDLCQRVHFIHPYDKSLPEICVHPGWQVPKGLEGRWEPGSLCSIPIPEMCRNWPAIDIWISPLEKIKLDDWVKERGAPGMLSNLWLTQGQETNAS